jgi:DNA-binding CsgD family transcriptional regulator
MPHGVDIKRYSELLDKLYQGPFEAKPFSTFLQELRAILALNFTTLILRQPNSQDAGVQFMSGDNKPHSNLEFDYNSYHAYYALDPLTNLPVNKVVLLEEVIPADKLESNEFYKLCLEPEDIYHVAGIDLRDDSGHRYSLRLCRPRSGKRFSQDERAFIEMLATHICRAVSNGVRLVQLDSERQFYAKATFGRTIGTVILDEHGHILQTNAAADRFFLEKDGISRLHNQIHIKNAELNEALRNYIQTALQAQRREEDVPIPIQAMSVPRPSGKTDYELVVKSLPIDRYIVPSHTPHLIIFISNPAEKIEISARTLMTLYHLTLTEATLTILLAEGKTLDEVSQELNIARNTARAHLRAIFSKTGVTQQSMLVSLVLKSLASIAP